MAVAATHDVSAAQFYCLDFGGGALSSLRHVPHVGSVAGRSDADLCRRTVAEIESVLQAREARFRRLGIDSMADYRRLRADGDAAVADDPFGDVFLVIDGLATLRQEFEPLEPSLTAIAAQGLSFGVHVVVTASRWAEIRPALKDQIGTRIELRLGDPADSEMDRRRARQLAHIPPGRGITRDGKEMVIALPRLDGKPTPARWAGRCAPPIELLPFQVPHDNVATSASRALQRRSSSVSASANCNQLYWISPNSRISSCWVKANAARPRPCVCCVERSSGRTPPTRCRSRSSTFAGRCSVLSNPHTSAAMRCRPPR